MGAAATRLVPRERLIASQARQSRERAGRAAGGPGWQHRPAAPSRRRPGAAGGDQHGAHARQGTGRDHRRRSVRWLAARLRRGWRGRPAALSGPPGTRPAAAAPPCGGPTELWLTLRRNILPPRRSGRALPSVYTIELVLKYGRRARRPGTHGRPIERGPAWDGDYRAGPRGHLCKTPFRALQADCSHTPSPASVSLRSPGLAATPGAVSAPAHNQVRRQPRPFGPARPATSVAARPAKRRGGHRLPGA